MLAVLTRLVAQIEWRLPHAAHARDPEVPEDDPDPGTPGPARYDAAACTACSPVGDPDHDLGEWFDELRRELDHVLVRPPRRP